MHVDRTHDPDRRSWVKSANGHADFPLQNLPLGIFSTASTPAHRGGLAIGDLVLDLAALVRTGVLKGAAHDAALLASGPSLNAFLAAGAEARVALRLALVDLLEDGAPARSAIEPLLTPTAACTLHLPCTIGDYTDFYAGIHHALNVGRQFRPDQPLLPNYKHVPIGYHGRSSSIVPSGTAIRRPHGQRKAPADDLPTFGPTRRLDYELELGVWIGPGNALGSPVAMAEAERHIAGFCLLNDWSARDIQAWEYQPLGPFLAKNFATSISPWVVLPEALGPFRVAPRPRPEGDPTPLPYLLDGGDQARGALDLELEVLLHTAVGKATSRPPERLSVGNAQDLYWTVGQLVAHHTCNGCNLRPGDLLGSGTISAPTPEGYGSLLELTQGGAQPKTLATGETRAFLEDSDEVIFRARARREGYASLGFGEVRGVVLPASA